MSVPGHIGISPTLRDAFSDPDDRDAPATATASAIRLEALRRRHERLGRKIAKLVDERGAVEDEMAAIHRRMREDFAAAHPGSPDGVALLRAIRVFVPANEGDSAFSMRRYGPVYEIKWTPEYLDILAAGLAAKWSVNRESGRLLVGVKP